jgi:hypothetical protein
MHAFLRPELMTTRQTSLICRPTRSSRPEQRRCDVTKPHPVAVHQSRHEAMNASNSRRWLTRLGGACAMGAREDQLTDGAQDAGSGAQGQ